MPGQLPEELLVAIGRLAPEEIVEMIARSPDWREAVRPYTEIERVYPDDPVEFIESEIKIGLTQPQKDICYSVRDNFKTVAESGHSVGKSVVSAAIACWWLTTHKPSIVVTLAPSRKQVENILWRYIRFYGKSAGLPGRILDSARWEMGSEEKSEIHYAVGISPKRANEWELNAMQGFHGRYLLVIMDEAAGMPRIMYDAIMNLATSTDNRILAIGNPIAQIGPFWDACNSGTWQHFQISCLDHPNVVEKQDIVPGAVSYAWVQAMVRDHCILTEAGIPGAIQWESRWYMPDAIFQSRVLGRAPAEGDMQLIPYSWIYAAQNIEVEASGEKVIGFDPAGQGGDEAVMLCRQGGKILWIRARRPVTKDVTGELAGWLMNVMAEEGVQRAYVDVIGIGEGVTNTCHRGGWSVVGVNVNRSAFHPRQFANLRAELYWRIRDALRTNSLELPDDDMLAADLAAPKQKFDYLGRTLIEEKEEIRNKINRSPDRSDALSLSFYFGLPNVGDGFPDAPKAIAESRWAVPKVAENDPMQRAGSRWTVGTLSGRRRFGRRIG